MAYYLNTIKNNDINFRILRKSIFKSKSLHNYIDKNKRLFFIIYNYFVFLFRLLKNKFYFYNQLRMCDF